ncbi:unnamed protein product, partial [marine sediment metagenome]
YHLLKSLENCMDSLKEQINILESAEARLMVPMGEHMGFKGEMH